MKPKLLLLDANVVIECYRVSVWDRLLDVTDIVVPSIIAHDEAFYSQNGNIVTPINLPVLIEQNKIREMTASIEDFIAVKETLNEFPLTELHDGELEALAIMQSQQLDEYRFSSGDKTAIHAMCVLGLSEYGISLENILREYGFQKKLEWEFTQEYFKQHVDRGAAIRLQNMKL